MSKLSVTLRRLKQDIKIIIILFMFIPAIVFLLYLLPDNFKDKLILNLSEPSLVSIFFSNYVHKTYSHLKGNISNYYLVMFFVFLLNLSTNRRKFYLDLSLIFLVLPFFNYVINLLIFKIFLHSNIKRTYGFSAIVSGFFGYLSYSLMYFLKDVHKTRIGYRLPLIILAIYTLPIINFIRAKIGIQRTYFILFSLFIITFLCYISREEIAEFKNIKKDFRVLILTTSSFLLLFMGLYALFPVKLIKGHEFVNIFSHYFSFVFGMVVPWSLKYWKDRK